MDKRVGMEVGWLEKLLNEIPAAITNFIFDFRLSTKNFFADKLEQTSQTSLKGYYSVLKNFVIVHKWSSLTTQAMSFHFLSISEILHEGQFVTSIMLKGDCNVLFNILVSKQNWETCKHINT